MGNYLEVVRSFLNKLKKDNVGAYAGQATLFIVMSVIPFLLVLTFFLRFTPIEEQAILDAIASIAPNRVSPLLVTVLDEVYQNSIKLLTPSLVIAVYSSAKAVQSLRYGLNIVYDIDETRNWLFLRLRAMMETLVLIFVIFVVMILLVFGDRIQAMMNVYMPLAAKAAETVLQARLVIIYIVLIGVFCFIYKFLPNRKATFRSQLIGAVLCTTAWYIFSFLLSFYVNYFNGFSLYGSLTTILLIMMWLYICLYIFLACGEINNRFEILWKQIKSAQAKNKRKKMEKLVQERRRKREEQKRREQENNYR